MGGTVQQKKYSNALTTADNTIHTKCLTCPADCCMVWMGMVVAFSGR